MEEHCLGPSAYLFEQMPETVECSGSSRNQRELNGIRKWISKNLLLILTVLGVTIGVTIGFVVRPVHPSKTVIILLSYPGELFMRILKLLILPLIISSLVAGSASLNAHLNGRIAIRTFVYFLITSLMNAVLGVVIACAVHPGDPDLKSTNYINEEQSRRTSVMDSLLDLGRNIVADNIFQATFQQAYTDYINITVRVFNEESGVFDFVDAAEPLLKYRSGTNTVGIVVFCLAFGTVLGTLGPKSKTVIDFFSVIFEVVMKLVTGVIWLSPLGICSIIAGKILAVDNIASVFTQLCWFIITVIIGVFIYQLIIMQLIYLVFLKTNPFPFYLGLGQGTITAFATASTAAALPVTLTLMEDKLKVDSRITRFVLPVGCNINMDGTALFIAVGSIFFAQTHNIPLGIGELLTICFTSTIASFSSASVPSAALVLLLMVLTTVNIPDQDVFLLFAIDWLVDRFRTTNNMLGDCYAAAVVEKLSQEELTTCSTIFYQELSLSENNSKTKEKSTVIEIEELRNGGAPT